MRGLDGALAERFRTHLQTLRSARELLRARENVHREAPLPTARREVDALLGGGLERGVLTELVGGRTGGRFGLVLSALAATTAVGESAALVDLGDALDPQAAAHAGCALERLLWVRPERLREALAATEMALQSGFPLVVLDLGCPPIPGGRGMESAWLRLQRAAVSQGAGLLVSSPYRVSGTAAGTVLRVHPGHGVWAGQGAEPRVLAAVAARVELEKSRAAESARRQEREAGTAALVARVEGSLAEELARAAARWRASLATPPPSAAAEHPARTAVARPVRRAPPSDRRPARTLPAFHPGAFVPSATPGTAPLPAPAPAPGP